MMTTWEDILELRRGEWLKALQAAESEHQAIVDQIASISQQPTATFDDAVMITLWFKAGASRITQIETLQKREMACQGRIVQCRIMLQGVSRQIRTLHRLRARRQHEAQRQTMHRLERAMVHWHGWQSAPRRDG